MIEYFDEKLGAIKVLNVTEARANFATVLADNKAHYIITKNNKPLRVIINYNAYEILKSYLKGELSAGDVDKIQFETEIAESDTETDITAQQRNPLRGMLESNMSLAQKVQPTKKIKPQTVPAMIPSKNFLAEKKYIEEKVDSSALDLLDQEDIEVKLEPAKRSKAKPIKEQEDYFQVSAGDEPEDLLSAPDEFDFEVADEVSEPTAQVATEPFKTAKNTQQKPDITPSQPNNEQVIATAETQPQPQMNTQESDYFQKYKKLYEKFSPPQEVLAEIQSSALPSLAREIVSEQAQPAQEQEFIPKSRASTTFQQPDSAQESQPNQPEQELTHQAETTPKQELPSLKDLLKELEEERLSDEDASGEMDEKEIDDLIYRITHDY